ncbi:replication initiator protein A [Acidaminococcus fermentans]|uniref:replication initiator protein A n=1 Tax=Acidaminococcus fermentans TaxID=905 RepID=UPI00241E1157|nr:replication initiator protein A [Acidaminococcus fermentans]
MGKIITIYDCDRKNEPFFQLPQKFFNENSKYKSMPLTCKVAYSILHQQMLLSRKNGKAEKENGEIYFFYRQEKLAEKLGIGRTAVCKIMKILKENGLIFTVHQGRGFPDKIYLYDLDPISGVHICHGRGDESKKLTSPRRPSDVSQVNRNNKEKVIKKKRECNLPTSLIERFEEPATKTIIPSVEEVRKYFEEHFPEKNPQALSLKFYDFYSAAEWKNRLGKPIVWRQLASRWGHEERVLLQKSSPQKTTSPNWWSPEKQQKENQESIERLKKMRAGELTY